MRLKAVPAISVAMALLAACGAPSVGPEVVDARIGEPTGPNGALYFVALGYGTDDRLLSVTTGASRSAELFSTEIDASGVESMEPVDWLDLPADGRLVLGPGGYHVMLDEVERLEVGDTVEVTTTWEHAGEVVIEAEVVDVADVSVVGHDMGG